MQNSLSTVFGARQLNKTKPQGLKGKLGYPLLTILVRLGEQAANVFQLQDIPAMEAASRIFHRCNVILLKSQLPNPMIIMTIMVRSLNSKQFSSTEGFCALRATGKPLFGRRG